MPLRTLLGLAALLAAQAPTATAQTSVLWRTYVEGANTVETSPDGSVTVSGTGITRLSPGGAVLWSTPRPGGNSATDIALGPDGEVYVLASVDTGGPTSRDLLVYRLNADGTLAWSHSYDGPNTGEIQQEWDTPEAIVVTSTGTVVTVAESGLLSNPGQTIWTQGYGPDGTLLWSRTSAESATAFPDARRADVDCDGNVFIAGSLSVLNDRTWPGLLLSYASDGTERFMTSLPGRTVADPVGESTVYVNEVAADCETGAVYVVGQDSYNVANPSGGRDIDKDAFVARFDGATPTWQVFPFGAYSGSGLSSTQGVQNIAVGGPDAIYASVEAGEVLNSPNRVEVVRLHADGSTAWLQTRTDANVRIQRHTVADADGVTLITSTGSTTHYESFDPDGVLQWSIARVNGEVGGPIMNRVETMVTHPDGGVVWLEGNGGHVVRAGLPPDVARVQIIHASAALSPFGPIEVYINQSPTSTTPDATVSFRGGSAFLTVPANEAIEVRARLQSPPPLPGLPQEYSFTQEAVAPGRYVVTLAGIPEPLLAFFAANPDGILLRLLLLLSHLDGLEPAAASGGVPVIVTNAVTDAPAIDVVVEGSGQVLANDLQYAETAAPTSLAPGTYRVEVRRASDQSLLEAVRLTLDGTEGSFPLTVSGFLDPSANQNGPALALTATDSTGTTVPGTVVTGTEAGVPGGWVLVAPNPSPPGATVRFVVPVPGPVRLTLIDVLGRHVAVLSEGTRLAGAHSAALPSALAPGTYVLRLEATDGGVSRRVTVL